MTIRSFLLTSLSNAVQVLVLFAVTTIIMDAIHWLMHLMMKSRWRWFRAIGGLHQTHHDLFDQELKLHDALFGRSVKRHLIPKFMMQLMICWLVGPLVFNDMAVQCTCVLITLFFTIELRLRGKEHVAYEVVPSARVGLVNDVPYHVLHHVHPNHFLGTITTIFDRIAGTACPLRGRTVALTGASGAFGSALETRLEKAGAKVIALKHGRDFAPGDYSQADAALQSAGILALCHGTKGEDAMWANCDSFVMLIERFRELTRDRRFAPEVWAVGSEIEAHPAFGIEELRRYAKSKRAFARDAARYYCDPDFLYRHIVPSAFRSAMGPGLISGGTAAGMALFFIKRGFRYVPVTYTGIALINAVPFLVRAWRVGPQPLTRSGAPIA